MIKLLSLTKRQIHIIFILASGLLPFMSHAEEGKSLKDLLIFESENGWFYMQGDLRFDLVGYGSDDDQSNPPGFFFPDAGKHFDYSPRLQASLDIWLGKQTYGFVKARWDDGVHPGVGAFYGSQAQARIDEAYLRYTLDGLDMSVQGGRFVPKFGTFLPRQDAWDMGLISYPALYEQISNVSDVPIPTSADHFASRKDKLDNKLVWVPVVWAQLYTTGFNVMGKAEKWDYAVNVTTSAPSSRGDMWTKTDFGDPTILLDIGYNPSPAWRFGAVASGGAYIQDKAEPNLPAGKDIGDYWQRNLGFNLTWKAGHWSVWSEAMYTEFDIPNVREDAKIYTYYIEAKYDFAPGWWVTGRWNHQLYNTIQTSSGEKDWDSEHIRVDLGIGHRFSRKFQVRTQYSYQHQQADFQNAEHFVAVELNWRI